MRSRATIMVLSVAACAVAALLLTAPPMARAAHESGPIRPLTSVVAWCGSYSAVSSERFARITTPDQWAALWTEHCGDKAERDSYREPVIPRIDFAQYMAVAIFGGQSTNVRAEELVTVDEFADHVRLRYEDRSYQTASAPREIRAKPGESAADAAKRGIEEFLKNPDPDAGGGNRTTPYGLFVLPRSDKPIIIEESRRGLKADPPTWVERARLDAVK